MKRIDGHVAAAWAPAIATLAVFQAQTALGNPVPASSRPRIVLDAPGHVLAEFQPASARGGVPGATFEVEDWRGRPVAGAGGVFDTAGTAIVSPLPAGYYRMVSARSPADAASAPRPGVVSDVLATIAVVSPPQSAIEGASGSTGFLAADTGPIWEVARGESFLCPWNGGDAQRTLADLARLCGFAHVRDRLSPGGVMPKPDFFDGSFFLRNAGLFAERGIGVCETFATAPAWTAPKDRMPTDLAAVWKMFERLAAEFGNGVEAWEFWNEPDIGFAPGPVWDYAAAMKAAYLGFKAGNPSATALSGALCTAPGNWYWRTLFANDAAKFTDAFNYHTYSPVAAYSQKFAALRDFLAGVGMGDRAIWLTEVGCNTEGAATDEGVMPQFKAHSPEQELAVAEYCPKALVALQMEGVARAYWFILGAYSERGGEKDWGLLRRDGTAKPVFAALATAVRELGDARLLGEIDAGEGVRAYLYEGLATPPDSLATEPCQTVVFWAEPGAKDAVLRLRDSVVSRGFGGVPRRSCRLVDMCGMISTPQLAHDDALALPATRFPQYLTGLRGLAPSKPAITPAKIGAPVAEPDEDLSVIVRVELDNRDWSVTRNKTRAVLNSETGRLRVEVWNLGSAAKEGTLEVSGGRLEGLSTNPISLGPRGTPPVVFDCVFAPPDGGAFETDLVLRGVFNGRRGSRTFVPVWLENRFLAGCEETPLAWRNLAAWARNDTAEKSMVSFDEEDNAIRFDWEWDPNAGRRQAYPRYRFRDGENLVGARMISFEVKSAQNKVENDFDRANLMLGDLELAFQPPNGNWERRNVELPPEGLENFREFKLGANPRGSKVTFWIRNVSVLKERLKER